MVTRNQACPGASEQLTNKQKSASNSSTTDATFCARCQNIDISHAGENVLNV